ncbi:gp26 family baseplate hub assembly chaperone [bacterium]|nr:gp26 family baseplate hub assembly chaperone [bacterium]
MPLPKISQPVFQLTLPSNGKVVHFRPFTVREEKILMMAQESGEKKDIINSYKQLINNCAIDPIDVDKMASFDLEYFFIQLRSKSVSNISKVQVKDQDDGEMYEVEINLDKIEIVKNDQISNNVKLTEDVGIILKYPTFNVLAGINDTEDKMDTTLAILRGCIDQVYEGEEVHDTANYSVSEMNDFILSLNKAQIEEIQKFFEAMPKLVYNAKYLDKEKQLKQLKIEGLDNFF